MGFFKNYYKKVGNDLLARNISYEQKNKLSKDTYLSLSLSEDNNSKLLWNLYAAGGFCLGFATEYLEKLASHLFINKGDLDPETNKFKAGCVYIENSKSERSALKQVHYFNESELVDLVQKTARNPYETYEVLDKMASTSKTDFWKEEREWRLIFDFENDPYGMYSPLDGLPIKFAKLCAKYKTQIDNLTDEDGKTSSFEYKKMSALFVPFDKTELREVVLAPDNSMSIGEVEDQLAKYGFPASIKVYKATANI